MENKEQKPTGGRGKKILIYIIVGWFVLGVASSLIISFVVPIIPKDCATTECFVEAANNCRNAKLEVVDDADMLWRYRAAAFCGGFEKILVVLNDKETARMKELLEGKSLSCDYIKGNFDKRWLITSIFGLENCQGELKEILGQLLFLIQ
ncbi:MAG: hypothetical protein AAB797_01300 [Patescibacteria group bacterium]